jgi:hypothetical protein
MEVVKRHARKRARVIGAAIFQDWVDHAERRRPDDVTVMVVAVQPDAVEPREARS